MIINRMMPYQAPDPLSLFTPVDSARAGQAAQAYGTTTSTPISQLSQPTSPYVAPNLLSAPKPLPGGVPPQDGLELFAPSNAVMKGPPPPPDWTDPAIANNPELPAFYATHQPTFEAAPGLHYGPDKPTLTPKEQASTGGGDMELYGPPSPPQQTSAPAAPKAPSAASQVGSMAGQAGGYYAGQAASNAIFGTGAATGAAPATPTILGTTSYQAGSLPAAANTGAAAGQAGLGSTAANLGAATAAVYGTYQLGQNLTDDKKDAKGGAMQGAIAGAGYGSYFGPWGTAIGAVVGAAAGALLGGTIGHGHNYFEKIKRRKLRDGLSEQGFLDENHNLTLDDGSQMNFTNMEDDYVIDFNNPTSEQLVGWVQPFAYAVADGNQKMADDFTASVVKQLQAGGETDLNKLRDKMLLLTKKFQMKPSELKTFLTNKTKAEENPLEQSKYEAFLAAIDSLKSGGGIQVKPKTDAGVPSATMPASGPPLPSGASAGPRTQNGQAPAQIPRDQLVRPMPYGAARMK